MEIEKINDLSLKASEFFAKGLYIEALKIYYTILATDLNNSAYHYNVGVACSVLGDIELAVAFYKRAIRLDENNIRAINNLAGIYVYNLQNFDAAVEYLDYAIKIAPNDAEAYNIYGNIYLSKKDYKKAEMYLKKAILFDDKYFKNHFDMARVCIGLERETEAKKMLEKCLELYPDYEPAVKLKDTL